MRLIGTVVRRHEGVCVQVLAALPCFWHPSRVQILHLTEVVIVDLGNE